MKTKIFITTLTLLLIATLTTCKKEPEAPAGGNKIEFGQTTTDSVTYFAAKVTTQIKSTGGNTITQHGHCWSTKSKPTTDDAKTTQGKLDGPGTYTSELTGLQDNTTYYVRSYVTYPNGTVYGLEQTLKTLETRPPQVTTAEVIGITRTSAQCGGTNDNGGLTVTTHGVCWNTNENPTLENNTGYTTDGSGTSNFNSELTGLAENTNYYVAAYATNEKGTGYGEVKSFKTHLYYTPIVTTAEITEITWNSAKSGGAVSGENIGTITARGVCWNTTGNPTLENSMGHTTEGTGTGNFTSELTGLTESTSYYVASYATNEEGTAYGQMKQFVTKEPLPDFVPVAGGTFQMGSNDGGSDEQPIHTVTLSSFEISKYEVTNSQFCEFLNDIGCNSNGNYNDPEYGNVEYIDMDDGVVQIDYTGGQFVPENGKEDFPVIEVSWYGANAFALWAGERLPTEAEWEFAARGGNQSDGYTYSGSNNVDDVAWYEGNSGGHTHEVGTKAPNELGIYDMSGNVYEWCHDWYDENYYSGSPENNPQGPESGTHRVLRGGSWLNNGADYCRVANRYRYNPVFSYDIFGFRLVRQY